MYHLRRPSPSHTSNMLYAHKHARMHALSLAQDTSLEPRPGTALPLVRDEAGNPVGRGLLLQRERREAARCLLYAAAREPALAPAVAGELLELLAGLLSRMGGTGEGRGQAGGGRGCSAAWAAQVRGGGRREVGGG